MKDEYKWVIQSKRTAHLYLMNRPRKREINPQYTVLIVWGKDNRYKIRMKFPSYKFIRLFEVVGRL